MASVQAVPKLKTAKKVKTVQRKWKLFRANEPLLSVFMWGINHSVTELNHVNVPVMLMPEDFKAYTKVRVDNHLFNKDNMPSHFKVKEYCPIVFRNLRERFGIDDQDYMNSLTKQPICTDSPGRSGARMLMSQDRKYFIKTLVSEEVEQMHHLLKQYHQHIVECHADTLLPHYLGMYRLTVNDIETYLIVMRNVFSPRVPIHKKYDLKGSTVDRCASDKEKAKDLPTYKDNDFLTDGAKINVGVEAKVKLIEKLNKDVEVHRLSIINSTGGKQGKRGLMEFNPFPDNKILDLSNLKGVADDNVKFLSNAHMMDYSLIVGIHDCEKQDSMGEQNISEDDFIDEESEEENGLDGEDMQDMTGFAPTPPDSPQPYSPPAFEGHIDPDYERFALKSAEDGPKKEIYFLALIDILTKYGMKKRSAQAAKTLKHGAGAEISTVHPDQYAKRFLDFIDKCIE